MMQTDERNTPFWCGIRLILGLAQMTGAVISLMLLLRTGLNTWSIAAASLTTLCTFVSRTLFHARQRQT